MTTVENPGAPPSRTEAARGGRRVNTGRRKGSGRGLTELVQVHVTKNQKKLFKAIGGKEWFRSMLARAESILPPKAISYAKDPMRLRVKFMECAVQAGFPSPASDYVEGELDPNSYLVKNPESTYFVRATGNSMTGAGIFPGDILVVDRLLEPRDGDIVIACVNNEFTVKRLVMNGKFPELHPDNPTGAFPVMRPGEFDEWQLVGVVTHSMRTFRKTSVWD